MSFSERHGDSEVSGDFSRLNKLVENLGKNYHVDIGYLGSEMDSESGLTVAGIMAVHEFGTDKAGPKKKTHIPERSTIRMPLTTKTADIEKQVNKNLQKHLEDGDIKAIYKDIGIAGEAVIQEAFETGGFGTWEPLKPGTIAQKGSDAILIDKGTASQAVTSKVGGGG